MIEHKLRTDPAMDRAVAAAEAATTDLPAIVTGLDVAQMDKREWAAMRAAHDWRPIYNRDAMIRMDHPDVKRALAAADSWLGA